MARCFAFNPQAYAQKLAFKEATLNESFKLQKECKNTEAPRKTEKKGKRGREKIIDDVYKDAHNLKVKESCVKKFSNGKRIGDHISTSHSKRSEDSSEEQRSGVTEEHGSPVCSQSTDAMSGRRRKSDDASRSFDDTPPVPGIERCGRILRIKLPVKKQKLDEPPKSSDILSQPPRDIGSQQQPIASTSEPSMPEKFETSVKGNGVPSSSKPSSSAVPLREGSTEFLYKTLVEDWMPPPIIFEASSDDESWLFERKKLKGCAESCTSESDTPLSNTNLWPKASYLKDAGIYALPYTVPF